MKKEEIFVFTTPNGVQKKAIVLSSIVKFDPSFPDAVEVRYLCYTADKQLVFIKCMETDWEIYPSSKYMDDDYDPANGLLLDDSDIEIVTVNATLPFEQSIMDNYSL